VTFVFNESQLRYGFCRSLHSFPFSVLTLHLALLTFYLFPNATQNISEGKVVRLAYLEKSWKKI